jgi:23S rRNA (uracil1939-C5)-methyltransferase
MQLRTTTPLYGGLSLARDEKVYFVKGAIPHETVEVKVTDRKKDYILAETTEVLDPSPFRTAPPCPVYGICGGCHYQHVEYEHQLSMKEEIICDCLRRIGKFENLPFEEGAFGSPFGYKHRAQFKVSGGKIGFYRENSHDIVEFPRCLLLVDELNSAYSKLKNIEIPPGVKEISLTSGDCTIAHVGGDNIHQGFLEDLVEGDIVQGVSAHGHEMMGRQYSEFSLNDLRYVVSSRSFFQSNWEINLKLLALVEKTLSESGRYNTAEGTSVSSNERLLDLFGGAGNFSLPVSHLFHSIVVVEENGHSVADGQYNSEINNIRNVKFINSSVEDFKISGKFVTVIADPPRIGLTSRTLGKIIQLSSKTLLYISCNPATLSRDADKLKEYYSLDSVRLVDMFPQTYHCEIFCLFRLR